jgi:hypothetical protein
LRPVFRLPDADAVEVLLAVLDAEGEEEDEQAASTGPARSSGTASHVARLSLIF